MPCCPVLLSFYFTVIVSRNEINRDGDAGSEIYTQLIQQTQQQAPTAFLSASEIFRFRLFVVIIVCTKSIRLIAVSFESYWHLLT